MILGSYYLTHPGTADRSTATEKGEADSLVGDIFLRRAIFSVPGGIFGNRGDGVGDELFTGTIGADFVCARIGVHSALLPVREWRAAAV